MGSISKQTEYSIYVSTEWLGVYCLIFYVNNAIALWSIFRKAGKPGTLENSYTFQSILSVIGWPGIIPIYNYIVLLSVLDKPWWYLLLWFIPIVNVGFAAKNSSFSSIEEDFFRLGIYSCDCHVQIGRLFHSIWPVQIGSNFSSSHFSPYSRIR